MNDKTIHVVRGASAAGGVLASKVADRPSILVQDDDLSVGRLERYPSPESWVSARENEWRKLLETIGETLPDANPDDRVARADVLKRADRLGSADDIILWAGCGVADQWFLASAINLTGLLDCSARLSIVQFEKHTRSGYPIFGLGELNPDQIRDGFQPAPLSPRHRDDLRKLWSAVTAAHPGELASLQRDGENPSPIQKAVSAYVTRFPDVETGLSDWDRVLLETGAPGRTRITSVVGNAIRSNRSLDTVGDEFLFSRVLRMSDANLDQPALSYSGGLVRHDPGNVELTSFGKELLNGRANYVETNGIDMWLGGIHLSSDEERVWSRQGYQLLL